MLARNSSFALNVEHAGQRNGLLRPAGDHALVDAQLPGEIDMAKALGLEEIRKGGCVHDARLVAQLATEVKRNPLTTWLRVVARFS